MDAYLKKRANPHLVRKLIELVTMTNAIEPEPNDKLEDLGFSITDLVAFEMKVEEHFNIYTASPETWMDKNDNIYILAIKLTQQLELHKKQYPPNEPV